MKEPLKDSPIQTPAARLHSFENFYLFLVVGCGVLCAASVAVAVFSKVVFGIFAAIMTAVIYRYCLTDELKKQLGLSQHRVSDGVALTVVKRIDSDPVLSLPRRLLWLDVTELCGAQNGAGEGVTELVLPDTVKRIAADVLAQFPHLQTIRFDGPAEQWSTVSKPDVSAYEIIVK